MKRIRRVLAWVGFLTSLLCISASAEVKPYAKITATDTPCIIEPVFIQPMDGGCSFSAEGAAAPSAVLIRLNEEGKVPAGVEESAKSVQEILEEIGDRAMPVFAVSDSSQGIFLAEELLRLEVEDAFVLSTSPEAVKAARKASPILRGILDCTEAYRNMESLNENQLDALRAQAFSHEAQTVLLPAPTAARETVEYLQKGGVSVWVSAPESVTSAADAMWLLVSGATGIMSKDHAQIVQWACQYLGENAMLSRPFSIGHRGAPHLAPENTVEGAKLAFERGADIVECDVYLTADRQLAVSHDPTTGRLWSEDLDIESSTMEQLKALTVKKKYEGTPFADCRMPTLEEFLQVFGGGEGRLFIELKSLRPEAAALLAEQIQAYHMEARVTVISFSAVQLFRVREALPQVPVGVLTSVVPRETNTEESLWEVLSLTQPLNATLNPSFGNAGPKGHQSLLYRGVSSWMWTFTDRQRLDEYFLMGTAGLTTDNPELFEKLAACLTAEESSYTLKAGESCQVKAGVRTYAGGAEDVSGQVRAISLEGEEQIRLEEDGTLTAIGKGGTAAFMLEYTAASLNGETYRLYTQPIRVTVVRQGISGWLMAGIGAAVLLAAAAAWLLCRRGRNRRRNTAEKEGNS